MLLLDGGCFCLRFRFRYFLILGMPTNLLACFARKRKAEIIGGEEEEGGKRRKRVRMYFSKRVFFGFCFFGLLMDCLLLVLSIYLFTFPFPFFSPFFS